MKILEIEGNRPLIGTVGIGGAKNSAVALIPAAILSDNKNMTLHELTDEFLLYLGAVRGISENTVKGYGNNMSLRTPVFKQRRKIPEKNFKFFINFL